MQRTWARWSIEYNPHATRGCYASCPATSECDCEYCQNADALGERIFPTDFLDVLAELGIDPTKPAEWLHYSKEASGLYLTGGIYHFIGSILSGANAFHQQDGINSVRFENWNSCLEFGLTARPQLVRDAFQGQPLVQLEFVTQIPWVLEVPEPE